MIAHRRGVITILNRDAMMKRSNVLGSVAEFERSMMLERQREGIAKAKAEGKYKGRAPTAQAKAEDVLRLLGDGIGACQVASQLGISRSSVWRIMRANGESLQAA